MDEKWVDLIYNGINFRDRFEISEFGKIRNKETGNYTKASWEGLIYYTNIYYGGRSYRIKVGLAQEESGLERTILDKPHQTKVSLVDMMHELMERLDVLEQVIADLQATNN